MSTAGVEFLEAAMRDGAVTGRDGRGLMPLEEARRLVERANEFRKGQGRMVQGRWVLDSDILWAALMSLEGPEEFLREATRLRWFFHPRGEDNLAPIARYGVAILPWLKSFLRPGGRFVDVPWCVRPCLMAIDRPEVLDHLWAARCVSTGAGDEWPGPFAVDNPGDADRRSGTNLDAPAPVEPDSDADALVMTWLHAHPAVGYPRLAALAKAGDGRARRMLRALAQAAPSDVFGPVQAVLGEQEARRIFRDVGLPTSLDARCIEATLGAASEWPQLFGDAPERAYHAMRLVAARAAQGDGWGIVIERLEGDTVESATVRRFVYGSNVTSGPVEAEAAPLFSVDDESDASWAADLEGVRIDGPCGSLKLRSSMVRELQLAPRMGTAPGIASSRPSLMIRAYLAMNGSDVFGDPQASAALLGLGDDAVVLVVSDAFEHCVGRGGPSAYPSAWRVGPEESLVYQSLARALVAGDGALFEEGTSNVDFRLHVLAEIEGE